MSPLLEAGTTEFSSLLKRPVSMRKRKESLLSEKQDITSGTVSSESESNGKDSEFTTSLAADRPTTSWPEWTTKERLLQSVARFLMRLYVRCTISAYRLAEPLQFCVSAKSLSSGLWVSVTITQLSEKSILITHFGAQSTKPGSLQPTTHPTSSGEITICCPCCSLVFKEHLK